MRITSRPAQCLRNRVAASQKISTVPSPVLLALAAVLSSRGGGSPARSSRASAEAEAIRGVPGAGEGA